jgi:integrase
MKRGKVVGKRPFTKEQLEKIWRVLDEINDADLTLLFDLARNTGARLHDLVSWKWDEHLRFNITTIGGEVKVEGVVEWMPNKTKNSSRKVMIIPILDERVVANLYERYQQRGDGEEYILPKMLELYNKNKACALTNLCQKVFVKAGLETRQMVEGNSRANCVYGIHSFRHTLVSELFEKGVDLATIQHLYTGHGSSFMTELYAHANMDKKRVDLSNLAHIGEVQHSAWVEGLSDEDKVAYDVISLMEGASPLAKEHLRGLVCVKGKEELIAIRDWIDKRIAQIS